MHLFIAVFENPISDETKAATKSLDSVYELSDRVMVVRDDSVDSPATLRKVLQLSEEPEGVDAIFKLNGSYSGIQLPEPVGLDGRE